MLSRRISLFLGMLLSGGMLFLPRIPLLILLFAFSFAATGYRAIPLISTRKIWFLLGVILFAAIIRPGPIDPESLMVRYANFFGGLCLLSVYLRCGYSKFSQDLFFYLPWMAAQAILTFLLANWAPSIFSNVKLPNDGSFFTILFLFNYHIVLEDFSGFNRPNGFFWEPGVYQIYMNLYLYLALFVFSSRRHAILALTSIACIYSTTGVLITCIILATALKQKISSASRRNRTILIAAGLLALPLVFAFAGKNINEKLTGELQGSALIRQYDLIAGLDAIRSYPLLGIGFDHDRFQSLVQNSTIAEDLLGFKSAPERSTSNGIIYLGYTLGIPLAIIFIAALFRQKIFREKILFGSILFISLIGEPLIFTPFFLMLIFSSLVSAKKNSHKPKLNKSTGGSS